MKNLAKQLKAFANERRLRIVLLLKRGGFWTVSDIAQSIKLSLRSTSRHLQLMKQAGIIEDEQNGLYIYYHLKKDNKLFEILDELIK